MCGRRFLLWPLSDFGLLFFEDKDKAGGGGGGGLSISVSVQIQCDEIVLQYICFDIRKDSLNIIGVDGCCEMVVNSCVTISLDA